MKRYNFKSKLMSVSIMFNFAYPYILQPIREAFLGVSEQAYKVNFSCGFNISRKLDGAPDVPMPPRLTIDFHEQWPV
jgi:hypothetical protein